MSDWQPAQYLKYRNERTQPSIDLANRICHMNPLRVIDIGCGPGNSTVILKNQWPNADVYGLDNSKNMLQKAKTDYPDLHWLLMDANSDMSSLGQFDIVFTNAALQWMPEHEVLIPKMYSMLNENGVLAAQVPYVKHLPIYAEILALTQTEKWTEYFYSLPEFPRHLPYDHYYNIICGLTDKIEIWQTDYIHVMHSHDDIVEWYTGTGLRPFLDLLPDNEMRANFCEEYKKRLCQAYPIKKNSKVLLPFTRIFFVVYK